MFSKKINIFNIQIIYSLHNEHVKSDRGEMDEADIFNGGT